MSRFFAGCLLLLLTLPSLPAQNARQPVQVPESGGSPTGADFAVSSEDDDDWFAAAGHTYAATPGIWVRFTEDGGASWSQPAVRYADPQSVGLCPTVLIIEETVFVCWVERITNQGVERHLLYSDVTPDGGQTWRGPQRMPGNLPPSGASVSGYAQVGTRWAGAIYTYTLVLLEISGSSNDELILIASNPGGASYDPPLPVPDRNPQAADVDQFSLAVSQSAVHLAWVDDRAATLPGDDLYFRNLPAGTLLLSPEQKLTSRSQVFDGELLLAAEFGRVAAAWLETPSAAHQVLQAVVSNDGGASFAAEQVVGGYVPQIDDVDHPDLAIRRADQSAVLAWSDDRSGQDRVYASVLGPGASQWNADALVFQAPATQPTVTASRQPGGPILAAASSTQGYLGSLSSDLAGSWPAAFPLAPAGLQFEAPVAASHDPLYDDFSVSWMASAGGTLHQYVGGVRPQTLTMDATTFSPGAPAFFEVLHFPAAQAGSWFQVLISGGRGELPLPGDGRNLGLRNDALLQGYLQRPELRGVLDAAGAGRTQPLDMPLLPAGTPLYLVAVSWTSGGFGSITDVVQAVLGG